MSNTAIIGLGPDAPDNFIPLDVACRLLAGGTEAALAAASEYLLIAAASQGVTGNGERIDIKLRWCRPDLGEQIYVHASDVEALRERFGQWIGGLIPADQLAPALRTSSTDGDKAAQRTFVAAGQNLCLQYLVSLMKSKDPEEGEDKPTLKKNLTKKFGISGNQFNDVWSAAAAESGNRVWTQAGRRRKKKS